MADTEDALEIKCENIMNLVVESRKHFKKICKEYDNKSSVMKNKLLSLQTETYANINLKLKYPIPDANDSTNDIDDFIIEFEERLKRIEALKANVKNTQAVVMQLKADNIGRKLREPLDPEVMLAHAKEKKI